MRMIILLIISGSLGACGDTRINNVQLPLLVRPTLPAITATELKSCPINVRKKIIARDILRKAHCTKLEVIIRDNNL